MISFKSGSYVKIVRIALIIFTLNVFTFSGCRGMYKPTSNQYKISSDGDITSSNLIISASSSETADSSSVSSNISSSKNSESNISQNNVSKSAINSVSSSIPTYTPSTSSQNMRVQAPSFPSQSKVNSVGSSTPANVIYLSKPTNPIEVKEIEYMVNLTSDQVKSIPKNSSYKDIIAKFGESLNFDCGLYTVYSVDNSKLLILIYNDINDICPLYGQELLSSAITVHNEYNSGRTGFCIVLRTASRGLLVCNPYADPNSVASLYCSSLTVDNNTKITFENGNPATLNDINIYDTIVVTSYGWVAASFPSQMNVNNIVILKSKLQ